MRRQLYFEIFAASLSAILLEIAYTRIFSFKVAYPFTYLILGIALLGLGAGAVLVSTSQKLAAWSAERVVTTALVGSSRVDLQACKLEYSIVSPK